MRKCIVLAIAGPTDQVAGRVGRMEWRLVGSGGAAIRLSP
jgi:hypothetical protein